jgi:hypothetical protein
VAQHSGYSGTFVTTQKGLNSQLNHSIECPILGRAARARSVHGGEVETLAISYG